MVPSGREQKLHGRRTFGGGGCGQWGRRWGRRSGFEMTHSSTCNATLAKKFWIQDVWNRCSQLHYLMHVLTSSAYSLGSILHLVGFYLLNSWPEVTMDCSVFVFNGNRLFESILSHCSQKNKCPAKHKVEQLGQFSTKTRANWPWKKKVLNSQLRVDVVKVKWGLLFPNLFGSPLC